VSLHVLEHSHSKWGPQLRLGAAVVSAVSGVLLFLVCRKLVWGRDESLTNAWIWLFALAPYFVYFFARYGWSAPAGLRSGSAPADPRSGWDTDFISIWTCSLLLLAAGRWASWADFFEDPIYDTFPPGLLRYAILSVTYTFLAFIVVTCWRLAQQKATGVRGTIIPWAASYIASVVLFLCSVFLIPV
jgi:hypothetical protein